MAPTRGISLLKSTPEATQANSAMVAIKVKVQPWATNSSALVCASAGTPFISRFSSSARLERRGVRDDRRLAAHLGVDLGPVFVGSARRRLRLRLCQHG